MRLFPPLLSYILLGILSIVLVVRGLIPAFTVIDSDFPNYYTAARIVLDGKPVNKLYDDDWFQETIHFYGIEQLGKFSPFPPATALVMLPVAGLEPLKALRLVTVINVALLISLIVLLSKALSLHLLDTSVFVLLSGHALFNCFRLGQLYLCVSFLMVAGYYALSKNKQVLAGFCFGLFIPIKYFPVIFVLFYAFRREWKLVASAFVTASVIVAVGILALGWDIHRDFLMSVIGKHLDSYLSLQNPFSATFQSWDSLLRRLMVFDESLNPAPLFHADDIFPYLKFTVLSIVGATGIVAVWKAQKLDSTESNSISLAFLGIGGLLIAPATGTYHYLLLLLPLGLYISNGMIRGYSTTVYVLLGLHAAIGFVPYSITQQFDGQGILTLLAYPRLAALTIMYVLIITKIRTVKHKVF